jgi:signal transduction histidine kinase
MIEASERRSRGVALFRIRLSAAMMVVIAAITALGLYIAQRNVAGNAERALQQNFQAELSALHKLQDLRRTALAERCRALAANARIHAALEDNALDLLYPSAKDELRDLMEGDEPASEPAVNSLRARFYRFLDSAGAVLPPPSPKDVGALSAAAENQLAVKKLPDTEQIGYLTHVDPAEPTADEITAEPIFSSETGEVISALVVGFKPFELEARHASVGINSGLWVGGQLILPSMPKTAQDELAGQIATAIATQEREQSNFTVRINAAPHLLFYKKLNPGSIFPPAYEICVYPLADWIAQLRRLRWRIGGTGIFLLLGGFVASHFIAMRFAKPVEQLAVDSEIDRVQRKQAEAALASTSEELKRSARYSADASHQLKSPVTVLRAGLEDLLARDDLKPEMYEELSGLLHQTHRLTGVIDDLLLLSRVDAGHLEIVSEPVNLSQLVDEWLDDLDALSDSPEVKIDKNLPAELFVAGEKRYTSLIVQNLLENARKYNRAGGRIEVVARQQNKHVVLTIGNSGRPIGRDTQEHIFERFHHSSNASGHGLGLNLARELVRLHGGELRLVHSADDWTVFEASFRALHPNGGTLI